MMKRLEDKSQYWGRMIGDLEMYSSQELMDTLQLLDFFKLKSPPKFSWNNQQALVDPQLAQVSLLCKWIIYAMES
jgi:hypothetical protein